MKKSIAKTTIRNVIDAVLVIMLFTVTAYALPSEGVTYDNTNSGSSATTVNEALDDLYTKVNDKQTEINRINGIGDALPSQILNGKTAYVQGKTITGTMPSKGATTYTPGKSNQTIASGYYLSGAQTIKGDANLVAGNIAKGKTIFGVAGSYTSDANAAAGNILSGKTAYVNGSKITGSMPNNGLLDWKPTTGTTYTLPAGYYSGGTLNSTSAFNKGKSSIENIVQLWRPVVTGNENPISYSGTYNFTESYSYVIVVDFTESIADTHFEVSNLTMVKQFDHPLWMEYVGVKIYKNANSSSSISYSFDNLNRAGIGVYGIK